MLMGVDRRVHEIIKDRSFSDGSIDDRGFNGIRNTTGALGRGTMTMTTGEMKGH